MHQVNDSELVALGRRVFADEDWQQSIAIHEELTRRLPTVPSHWMRLGRSLVGNGQAERGILPLRRAVALRKDSFATWLFLANAYAESSRLGRARVCAEKSLGLKPTKAGYELLVSIHLFAGDPELSEACAREAAECGLESARSELTHALALLTQGKLKEGWQRYERRHDVIPTKWEQFQANRWQGEDLNGKTLVILSEQGIGDAIQFARYGRILRERFPEATFWYFARSGLKSLLETAPEFSCVLGNKEVPPPCDFYVPAMTLPLLLEEWEEADDKPQCTATPYLQPNPENVQSWKEWFDKKYSDAAAKIGLVWRGNKQHSGDRFRSLAAHHLRRLGVWKQADFICLQQDVQQEEIEELRPWIDLKCFPNLDQNGGIFADTAAILTQLDLVITVDTAIAHLAGALGVPTWLILGRGADFRWLRERSDSELYPSIRIFRQERIGRWDPVIDQVATELGTKFPDLKPREAQLVGTSLAMNQTQVPASRKVAAQDWLNESLQMHQDGLELLRQARQRLLRLLENSLDKYVAGSIRQEIWNIEKNLGLHGPFFSQAGQDHYVAEHLFPELRTGVFLEIGGYNGCSGSNSYFFEKHRGWQGAIVEPSPSKAYAARRCRTCQVIEAAVAGESGTAEFLEVQAGYEQMSGLAAHYRPSKLSEVRNNPLHREQLIQVSQITLNELVRQAGLGRVDFCSIDVEGAEQEILSQCDWSKLDILVLAVENNTGSREGGVSDLIEPQGYELKTVIGKDEIFVRTQEFK